MVRKLRLLLLLKKYRKMKTFNIQIRIDYHYLECEFSPDTPCFFADKVRELAKDYFKDITNPK